MQAPDFRESIQELTGALKVRVIDEGTGQVVLLLHGNPDNADEWKPLIRHLRNDFRCIAPDLPGYGRRDQTYKLPTQFNYTLQAQIGFVDEVLKALDITGKVILVVHDIGGIMGIPWASKNTARLKAMVFTNTVGFPGFRWFPLARLFGARSPLGRVVSSLNMGLLGLAGGSLFRRAFARQNPQLDAAEIERFTTNFALNATAKCTTQRQFREVTRSGYFDGYDAMLKTISAAVPTLTLWGDRDPYLPNTGLADQLFARKTVVLQNVGHWVPIVAADRLASEIREVAASTKPS